MGVADEEIVHYQGESGGVGVVAEEHGGGGFREVVLCEEGDKTELGQEAGLGEARDSLEDITKKKRFAVGVTEERKETSFVRVGREMEDTSMRTDSEREKWHQGSNRQYRWWP